MCAPSKPCLEKGRNPKAIETKVLESELQKLLAGSSHLQVHATAGLKFLHRRKQRAGNVPPTPTPVPLAEAMQEVKQEKNFPNLLQGGCRRCGEDGKNGQECSPKKNEMPIRSNCDAPCGEGTMERFQKGGNARVLESELQKLLACSSHFKVHATAGLKLLQRRKRRAEVTFDAIKPATAELQDALYTRQPEVIRQQMEVAKDLNKVGEGPSSKAILQAEDYAKKLEDYAKEQEAQREHEEAIKEPSDIEAAPTSIKEGTNAWQRRISDPATVKLTLAEACAKADEAAAKAMDKERPVMGLMMRREAKGSLLLDVEGDAEAKTVWPDSILNLFRQAGQPSKASTDMAVGAGMKSLMLYCGAAERPDPLKASTGGEDSLFICPNGSAAGVADGVGSMKGFGIDPKPFADKLMAAAKASALRPESEKVQMNIQCKAKVCLREAYEATQTPEIIYGASTALVCVLDPSEAKLGVANLGDSGLRILRWSDGFSKTHIAERTSEQQHGFNCPFSLSRLPKENRRDRVGKDMPEKAFAYTFEVQEGDVVLLGTDGIFDNLHDREVCDLATIAMQGGRQINPQRLAEAFVEAARVRIEDSNYKALTPFGIHAKNYGIKWQGGKMDDITVVACVVTPK